VNAPRENLLLALGNDLLGDDGVGLAAARLLRPEFAGAVEVVETSEAGLALVELMEGYQRALLLDSIATGRCPPGTVLEFSPGDFRRVLAPSPHYAGLPEVLALAGDLGIPFPREIRILAVEVAEPPTFRESLSPPVAEALPELVERARQVLEGWGGGGASETSAGRGPRRHLGIDVIN
jgi:hydrogenase maturation protease